MGAPTKTQVEAFTDRLSAIIQAMMDGRKASYTPATLTTLFTQVDASGDAAVEVALLASALGVDEAFLPENAATWLPQILAQPKIQAFLSAFNAHLLTAAGGSYASLRAYLADKSAKIHPLAGEAFRQLLGESCFTVSSVVSGVSNPTYAAVFPTRVYVGADGSLADELTDAADVGTADVTLFGSDNHTLYVGSDRTFTGVCDALSTLANVTITPTFQYWNGSAWATLTVTDSSVGLTKNDIITFTAPADWTRHYKDSGGTAMADACPLYYVRIARTADTVGTPPVGTCITLIPSAVAGPAGTGHLGIPQPPLALYRITAASTQTVTLPVSGIDGTRWTYPLGTENKLRLRALTPIASDLTPTITYTTSADGAGSTAQSAWTAPAALGTATVALTSSDQLKAARTTATVSTSATEGVYCLECETIRTPAI